MNCKIFVLFLLVFNFHAFANYSGREAPGAVQESSDDFDFEQESLDAAAIEENEKIANSATKTHSEICEWELQPNKNLITITELNSKSLKKQKISYLQRSYILSLEKAGIFERWSGRQALVQEKVKGKFITKIEDQLYPIRFLCDGYEYRVIDKKYVQNTDAYRTNLNPEEVAPVEPKQVSLSLKEKFNLAKNKFLEKPKKYSAVAALALGLTSGLAYEASIEIPHYLYMHSLDANGKAMEKQVDQRIEESKTLRKISNSNANKYLADFAFENCASMNLEQTLRIQHQLSVANSDIELTLTAKIIPHFFSVHILKLSPEQSNTLFEEQHKFLEKEDISRVSQMNQDLTPSRLQSFDLDFRDHLRKNPGLSQNELIVTFAQRVLTFSPSFSRELLGDVISENLIPEALDQNVSLATIQELIEKPIYTDKTFKARLIAQEMLLYPAMDPSFNKDYAPDASYSNALDNIINYENQHGTSVSHAISVAMGFGYKSQEVGNFLTWYMITHLDNLDFNSNLLVAMKSSTPSDLREHPKKETYRYKLLSYYLEHSGDTFTAEQKTKINNLLKQDWK